MKSLGIAVWGLGRHALMRIIPALSLMEKVSLIGVCSRSKDTVTKCSLDWNCKGWTNPTEMLNNKEIDVVFISTPIGIHATQARQALDLGKHVWCEKPLTCDYKDTQLLIKLAKKKNLMLAESFMYLHHPQFKKIQNFIDNIENGRVRSIVCRFGIPTIDTPSFRNNASLGGGAFWDIASYPVSAVLALFYGQSVKVLFSELINDKNTHLDTEGRVLLRFSNGVTAYLEWRTGVAYKNEIDLWLEKTSFFTDKIFSKPENFQPVYSIRDENGNESLKSGEKSEQFIEMFQNFSNMIGSTEQYSEMYKDILNRSGVMNEIIKHSKPNK